MKGEKKVRNIGIPGVEAPKETCTDINCPFHGQLGIRGRVFEGKVLSVKAAKSAVIEWERRVYVHKYERFERRLSCIIAYAPPCLHLKQGDTAVFGECRPLSKTKKFVVFQNKGVAK